MAASPVAAARRSAESSMASLKRSPDSSHLDHVSSQPSIPIDQLVHHLVAAKRSLSSMNLVLRANELANHARSAHEDTVILAAQTAFVRNSILDQVSILVKLRRSLQATYDWGKKDFKKLVRSMDEADGDLESTMSMLRNTVVQSGVRPPGEERKSLLDFVDELNVHKLRDAMKRSIEELQVRLALYLAMKACANHFRREYNKALIETYFASTPIFATSGGPFRLEAPTISRNRKCP